MQPFVALISVSHARRAAALGGVGAAVAIERPDGEWELSLEIEERVSRIRTARDAHSARTWRGAHRVIGFAKSLGLDQVTFAMQRDSAPVAPIEDLFTRSVS